MALVQAGETAQLAVLFERHHLTVFRYLLHLTRNRALSEDLGQEVFFRVLKYAASFDSSLSFPLWLHRLARNAYLDWLHKHRFEMDGTPIPDVQSSEPIAEEALARKQDVLLLEEALKSLPQEKREVLVLSRYQNLRYDEIASLLKCEVGTVKVRVHRALKDLRGKFCELRGEKVYDV